MENQIPQNEQTGELRLQIRQGDVLFERIPDDAPFSTEGMTQVKPEDGLTVIAHGEVTGHSHTLDRQLEGHISQAVPVNAKYWTPSGKVDDSGVLETKEDSYIKHHEHDPLLLPAGRYEVIKQREYVAQAPPRPVLD